MKKRVIVIAGPTASGKSNIGIKLSKKIDGVVISADSMQIYKKLNVGTAKVTKEEADGIRHELIDIIDFTDKFSVSNYKKMCYQKIEEILNENKVPIIVGGTGLYINAVVNNMNFEENDEEEEKIVDKKLYDLTNGKSNDELYELLKEMDLKACEKIDKNNRKRVIRAIKLALCGMNKSNIDERNDLWHKNESDYDFLVFYIDIKKDVLYDRINKRVDLMLEQGIMDEVSMLYKYKDSKEITATQAIGYKEFFGYLSGEKTLKECTELLKQKTRNYAKRQITWFKKLENKIIIDGTKSMEEIINSILREYNG